MSYYMVRQVPADEVSLDDADATIRTFETDSESMTAAAHIIGQLEDLDDTTVIVITKVVM